MVASGAGHGRGWSGIRAGGAGDGSDDCIARNAHPGPRLAVLFEGVVGLGPIPRGLPTLHGSVTRVPPPSRAEGDPLLFTVAEAAPLIREGRLSPVDLPRALVSPIERLNPPPNACIPVTPDLALAQEREAEEEV